MMASRCGPKGPAQKKLATYGKTPRPRYGDKATTSRPDSSLAASSLYDFPDSDGSTSPPSRLRATSPTRNGVSKAGSHGGYTGLKSTVPVRPPTTRKDDGSRKRKHSKAFNADAKPKPQSATANSPRAFTTPLKSPSKKVPAAIDERTGPASPAAKVTSDKTSVATSLPAQVSSAPNPRSQPKQSSKNLLSRPGNASSAGSRTRKPRLIDALASQKADSSTGDSDSESGSASSESEDDKDGTAIPNSQTPSSQRPPFPEREMWSRPTPSHTRTLASKKIRRTYSEVRSIRDDSQQQDDPFALPSDGQNDALLSSPLAKPSAGDFDFPADDFDLDDEDEGPKIAIKSVHELRRAGANNRFADEMEDLFSRIGTPGHPASSMRRNALLELAQKLQRGDFAIQFRDHAARDNIAKKIGKEEELIGGFALVASLVIFLASHNAPHLLRRLVEENVGKLLGRLLRASDDVDAIAGQKKSNLSRAGKTSVASIKSSLLGLSIWHGCKLTALSPRRVGLQLLQILLHNLDMRHRSAVVKELEGDLSDIVEYQAQEGSHDDVDFTLVVMILESESVGDTAALSHDQISNRASNSARFLQKALNQWPMNRGELESATLKLAINTTNTEIGARAFGHGPLLASLARCACDGMHQVQAAVDSRTLEGSLYDGLLLILGVMINIQEHHPPARASLDGQSLEMLVDLYLQNCQTVGHADSEDKSKVSVAVGYLAVLLGYLSLHGQARELIEGRTQGAGMRDLINSIREFIALHRSVDHKVNELEGLVSDLRRHSR